jgi:pullulanase/glycogen debranching enzyme
VSNNVECVSAGVKGAIGDNTNMWTPLFAADPEQSINYLSAHDNLSLADKIKKMGITGDYANRLQSYGNGIMLVSQGIPFIHAGAEFARTKNMNHNSYKSANGDNDIKWGQKKSNLGIFNYYKAMIEMRKAHPAFRMTTKDQIQSNVTTYGKDGAIVVDIKGSAVGDSWSNIKMVINSGNNLTIDGVDGWKKKVHGVTVSNDGQSGTNTAEGTAVTIWYK